MAVACATTASDFSVHEQGGFESSVQSTGGGGGYVDFTVEVANIGTQFSRCKVTARPRTSSNASGVLGGRKKPRPTAVQPNWTTPCAGTATEPCGATMTTS